MNANEPLTPLAKAINTYNNFIGHDFKPSQRFYDRIGCNHKRYAQILRGEKRPTIDEARALALFFAADINEIF